MKDFKIIPVIDILNCKAVHAIKGERAKYRPLKSHLFESSDPIAIIRSLKQKFNFIEFYIADLDSIINKTPNLKILKEVLKIPQIDIILDPGVVDLTDIKYFSEYKIKSLILGLETISSLKIIHQSSQILSENKIIVSIDLYKGQVLSRARDIKNFTPVEIVRKIESSGIKNIILLDLFRVGQKVGGIPLSYLEIVQNFSGNIYVGGGIKNIKDILDYKAQNFSGVLIATALYDGTIEIEELKEFSIS
jgi:phosphoribosylformimino-5-aminoimidazole carboxamide ribotide isomerase